MAYAKGSFNSRLDYVRYISPIIYIKISMVKFYLLESGLG